MNLLPKVLSRFRISPSLPSFWVLAWIATAGIGQAAGIPWANDQAAEFTLGSSAGSGTTNFNGPNDVAIDAVHGKLYVADNGNNRVLRFAYPVTSNSPVAEAVFGQADFTGIAVNRGGTPANNTMNNPVGVAVAANGDLWVLEAQNHRVIKIPAAYSATNGAAATVVLGQPDMTTVTNAGGSTSQATFGYPGDICIDSNGALWVADLGGNRVLRFDNVASKTNGANADGVLGQANFFASSANGGTGAPAANVMSSPYRIGVSGTTLWVADYNNHRVLRFDNAGAKSDGANADGVLGQANFTTGVANRGGSVDANTISTPYGVAADAAGTLYVSDGGNRRVLIFSSAASKANGAAADNYLGVSSFTAAGTMSGVTSQAYDDTAHRLEVIIGSQIFQYFNGYTTTTAITSDLNPSTTIGATVTFTATVTTADGGPTATGSVNFKEGATILGSGVLNGSGVATFATNSLTDGDHSIVAEYLQSNSHQGSTSSALSQVIGKFTPTVTLTASANPSTAGLSTLFTATVTKPSGTLLTPTGSVTFKVDGVTQSTPAVSGGVATWTTSALASGTYAITAAYSGDSNFRTVTSSTLSQIVNPAGLVTLTAIANAEHDIQGTTDIYVKGSDPSYSNMLYVGAVGSAGVPYPMSPAYKFDLSSVTGPIVSATLKLRVGWDISVPATLTVSVYGSDDDTWSDTTPVASVPATKITPALTTFAGAGLIADQSVPLPVTDFVKAQFAGDKVASFVMDSTADPETFDYVSFYALEAGAGYAPVLEIQTATAPFVTTQAASSIAETIATGNGTITATNGANATARGVVFWAYSNVDQVIGDSGVTNVAEAGDFGTGAFTASLTSLSANTQYNARAYAISPNGTAYGARVAFWTLANVPAAPIVNAPTFTTLNVTIDVNGNLASTEFCIQETSTGNYVQADGALGVSAVWQSAATWGTKTVTGLTTGSTYAFQVKARNGGGTETAYGATTSGVAAIAPTVTSISPAVGTYAGGTAVTITGTNFIAGSTVKIGGTSATGVTVVNTTTITAATPAGSVGAQNVVVTTPGGTATGVGLFNYFVPATVSSVSGPSNATYVAGQNLYFTVNFTQPVNVVTSGGTPYLTLTVGGASKHASYVAGSGTSTPVFSYTVVAGDLDADGIALSANITTNGGTINDASGNAAILTSAAASFAGVKVDAAAPTVASITAPSSGTYTSGQNLDFTVVFSEAVVVDTTNGTPYLTLIVGSRSVHANYLSGSGTGLLVFRYAVVADDYASGGIEITFGISLSGGTIKDAAGNSASIIAGPTFPLTGVKVDAVPPTVTSLSPATGLVAGGTSVTITGTHLASATAVKFGTASASITANTDTSITATAPAAGATGPVDVTVTTINGVSATSAADQFTYVAAPGAPTIGIATAGDAQASVAFTAPSDTGGVAITSYTVTSSPGSITATGSASPITVTGLTNGTAYTFTVTAANSVGNGAASTASNAVTPSADSTPPTIGTPTFSNLGAGQVTLALTSSETGTGYFTILSSTETAGTATETQAGQNSAGTVTRHGSLALTAATPGAYTVRNLAAETTYTVAFTAADAAGNLAPVQTATFTTTTATAVATAKWKLIGNESFSAGQADGLSLALAPDGTPYLAYSDRANSDNVTVMKCDGAAWVAVGTPPGRSYYTSLVFAPDGMPYLAYADSANSRKATVMKFDGTAWVAVGNVGFSSGSTGYTSLAFAPDGTPYVAYQDGANSSKATVMRFNGTAWVAVGSAGLSAGGAYDLSLAFASDATPYVAYRDGANSSKATVMKFNGTAWVVVGTAGLSDGVASTPSLAFAPDDTPYVAYQDGGNSDKATVMKFDGTAWAAVGTAGFTGGATRYTSLVIAPDTTPYVSYAATSSSNRPTVMKYDGTAWVYVGSNGVANSYSHATNLALAPDGTPYVAYTNGYSPNNYKVSVRALAEATVITSVDLPAAGTYKAGDMLNFTVHFSQPVNLSVPSGGALAIDLGVWNCYAKCDSGTNTPTLTFTYTVATGNNGTVAASGFTWYQSGGTFTDSDGISLSFTLPTLDTSGIVIDTNAPAEPYSITVTASSITGYGDTGSTIKVYDNGNYLGTATVDSNSQWSLPVTLADGLHSITATASDAAGNTITTSSATVQTVDAIPPTITSALTATGTYGTNFAYTITATDTNGLRNYPAPYVVQSLPAGLSLSGYSGVISGTPTEVGTFPITLNTYDPSGNKGTATLTLTVAKAAQTINLNSISDQAYDAANQSTVSLYSIASSGLPVTYKVDGPATLDYSPLYSGYYLILTGIGKITVTASQAGNENIDAATDVVQSFTAKPLATVTLSSQQTTVAYDGQPHGVTATTDPAGLAVVTEYYNIGRKIFSAMAMEGAVAEALKIDLKTPPTAVGNYEVDAYVDDGTYLGEGYGFLTIIPATPTTPATTTNNTTPVLNGIADPGSTVNIYDGTTLLGSVKASAAAEGSTTGTWTFTPTTALTEGTHSITITEPSTLVIKKDTVPAPVDEAAVQDTVAADAEAAVPIKALAAKIELTPLVSAALTLTIDTTVPVAPVSSTPSGTTTDGSPSFTGTAEPGSIVNLYEGTVLLGTTTADATTGAWSLTPSSALADGTHGLTVTATDAAGNVSDSSTTCTLIVGTAPTITTPPANKAVVAGSSATFGVVASGTAPFGYQWEKSTDGATYIALSGATADTFSLTSSSVGQTGYYRVVVSNAFGTVTSAAASLSVTPVYTVAKPDGYASATTGGAAGSSVVVLTAADFQTKATSTTACTITVVGQLSIGTVNVASNKTIQGADASATLVGNLNLNGASNVIIRGLHLSNPGTTIVADTYTDGGDALTITGSSKVFVTHCTFFDCADHDIKIVAASDNVTVSWCEFYASSSASLHRYSVQIGAASETQTQHVTLHHNWWTTNLDQQMPFVSYGQVHQYNNYVDATGNTAGTVASDHAQLLSERNVYANVANPLTKHSVSIASFVAGRIRTIGNIYTNCTGSTPDVGTDNVFTPNYSYEMLPASDVAIEVEARAGNTAGADYADTPVATASISQQMTAVSRKITYTLTAVPSGFTAATYQWRLGNTDIPGATSSTYTVASTQDALAGTYTVALTMASGDTVVSSSKVLSIDGEGDAATPRSAVGGGAPGLAYLAALALLGSLRLLRRARR